MLFSATLPPQVRHLTLEALSNAVHVTVGNTGEANEDVRQTVLLMANGEQKMQWLQARLQGFVDDGEVLVFVNQRATVEAIAGLVKVCGLLVGALFVVSTSKPLLILNQMLKEGASAPHVCILLQSLSCQPEHYYLRHGKLDQGVNAPQQLIAMLVLPISELLLRLVKARSTLLFRYKAPR
jgi:hypothetical protein